MLDSSFHVIVAVGPAVGHLNPSRDLCNRLADLSCLVTFLYAGRKEIEPFESKINPRIWWISEIPPEVPQEPIYTNLWLAVEAEDLVPDAVWTNNGSWPRASLVIVDMFAFYAERAAKAAGIPTALFCTCSVAATYLFDEVLMVNNQGASAQKLKMPFPIESVTIDGSDLPKLEPFTEKFLVIWNTLTETLRSTSALLFNDIRAWYGPDYLDAPFRQKYVGQNGRAPSLYYCGPLVVKPSRKRSIELEFLDQCPEDSVIYVGFGSWVEMTLSDLEEFAWGLFDSGYKFLWALRDLGGASNDLVSANGLPKEYEDVIKDRGRIVQWVDQKQVLSHPSLRGFISHGGWNSLSEAMILMGKPVLVVPISAEQGINSKMVTGLYKNGMALWEMSNKVLSRTHVSDSIKRAMENPKYREAAALLKQQALTAQNTAKKELIRFLDQTQQ